MIKSPIYIDEIKSAAANVLNREALSGKGILITGATGLVGRGLIDVLCRLNADYGARINIFAAGRDGEKLRVVFADCLADKHFNIVEQNLCEPFSCDIKADYIIHCAAVTQPSQFALKPLKTLTDNMAAQKNTLDFAVKVNAKRFLYLSSVEVYGHPATGQEVFKETDSGALNISELRSIYPETKRLSELMTLAYQKEYGLDVVIARPAKTFGANVDKSDNRAMAAFLQQAAGGQDIVLKTKGAQRFSFCYNADLSAALLTLLTSGMSSEAYNISGDGSDASIYDFASYCAKAGNVKVVVEDDGKNHGYATFSHTVVDNTKLKKLGFKPQYTLEKGIKNSIQTLRYAGV